MERISEIQLLGQPVTEFFTALAIIVIAVIVLQIAKRIMLSRLKDRESPAVRGIRRFLFPLLHIAALYAAVRTI